MPNYSKNTKLDMTIGQLSFQISEHTGGAYVSLNSDEHRGTHYPKREPCPESQSHTKHGCHEFNTLVFRAEDAEGSEQEVTVYLSTEQIAEVAETCAKLLAEAAEEG